MNKNWKRKILTAMVAMALIMQQVGASNIASAKENMEYIEQEMEIKGAFHDNDDLDEWEDADDIDEWEDADEEDEWGDSDDADEWEDADYEEDDYITTFYMEDLDDEDDTDEEDEWEDADEDEEDEWEDTDEEDWVEPSMAVSSLTLKAGKSSKIAIDGDWEEVVWKSSKNSVVKVDKNGKVTGVKAGKATITAIVYYYDYTEDLNEWEDADEEDEAADYDIAEEEDGELVTKILKCTVKVTATPLKISAKKVNLKVGKSKVLKVTGATGKVSWKTNNKRVAKVVNGKVTALKPGKAKITAKVGKKTLTCKVVVNKK